jgi:hypothetical protein
MLSIPVLRVNRLAAVILFASLAMSPAIHAQNLSLDGGDWKMRGYQLNSDAGQAYSPTMEEEGFRTVSLPGDTQLQLGLTGIERFRPSPELLDINKQEWWYRKHFRFPQPVKGNHTRIVFDGVDYFATVWLNRHLLGSHEGAYTNFSFDVTELLRVREDNVLAVKVSHPWIPPGGRSLDSQACAFISFYLRRESTDLGGMAEDDNGGQRIDPRNRTHSGRVSDDRLKPVPQGGGGTAGTPSGSPRRCGD